MPVFDSLDAYVCLAVSLLDSLPVSLFDLIDGDGLLGIRCICFQPKQEHAFSLGRYLIHLEAHMKTTTNMTASKTALQH